MAVLNRNVNNMNLSLERKAHLVVVFLTNEPAGFSLASLREEVNSSRGISTVLKLNRKRLAWGEKSFFDFAEPTRLPYRSVELNSVRQMFVESRYPDVLLCVLRTQRHTNFKYEVVAFRMQNDHDVRRFLDLFADLTQTPGPVDVRKTRDRATTTGFDRTEPYYRESSSTLLVRGRNTAPAAAAAAATGKASRDHGNVTWSQPDFDEFDRAEESSRRRRRRNYDTVDSRGAAPRVANEAKVYVDQTKGVVFSDTETSGTPTIRRRSDENKKKKKKHPKQSVSNGSLTAKSLSSPSIPESSYLARAVVGTRVGEASIAHVPLNDVNGFDGSDSMEEENEVGGRAGRNLQRRTTLVDNGIVKVTVEEYRDPEDEEGKTPDRSSNDQESNPYSLGAGGSRFVSESAASHPVIARNSARHHQRYPHQHHQHQSRNADTVDHPDADVTSSVRKVHGRSSVQRTQSESRDNGRQHHHGIENPLMDTDAVYHQSRPSGQRQRIAGDNVTRQPRGSAVVRTQPIRSRPESVYQLRSTTIQRQPIATSVTRVPEDAYQLRSATIRSKPTAGVMSDPVYQSRQVVLEEPGYFTDRRIVRGSSVHQRNDYERWDPVPVQHPTGHPKRSSVYHLEQRTSRR